MAITKVSVEMDAATLKVVQHALEHMALQVQATTNEINRQVNEAIAADLKKSTAPPDEPG